MELDSNQLRLILGKDPDLYFYDAAAYDQLPKAVIPPISMVINNEKADQRGGHWTALVITADRIGAYMCSLGVAPYGEIAKFLSRNAVCTYHNTNLIQNPLGQMCGYHCIYFVVSLMKERPLTDVVSAYSGNLTENDRNVYRWVQSYAASL